MIRGIYIAASSAISENKRIDVIANNIANINTIGYKKDTMISESFPEILLSKIGNDGIDKDILKNNSDNSISSENNGEIFSLTSNSTFFNIQTPLGVSKSKNIQFMVDEEGFLVTPKGDFVLGNNGRINVGDAQITIDKKGQILAGGAVVDRFKMTNALNVIGNFSYGVHVDEIVTNFEQGQLNPTENPFDLAIQGKGFFIVETPNGERYTRDGEFTKDAEGYLVTKEGYKVLGENGYIKIDANDVIINENGQVISGQEEIDKLKLVDFNDYKLLAKEGSGLFKLMSEGSENNNIKEFTGTVQQGFLEGSNVNSVRQMVDMITILRSYEANQKIIKTQDELLGKSVNEIGRL